MNLALKLAASVATVAAVSTAAWFAASPRVSTPADAAADQPPAASSAAPPDAGEEPVVCVGSDTILRAPISNGECAAGETRYALESGKPPDCDDCNPWAGPRSRSSGSDRLATLEERVNQLERSPLFTVMNESGKPILTVSPGMVRMFNGQSSPVAGIGATADGGFFTGRSATRGLEASIAASGTDVGVRVLENGISHLDLGGRKGQHALRVPALDGTIAGIGESRTGAGALIVGNRRGQLRASLTAPDHYGMVGINGSSGHAILALSPKASGGGMLAIGTAQGDSAVKMGNNYEKYGVVMVGPRLGLPLTMGSGLPGSYFLGCAGGPVCGATER